MVGAVQDGRLTFTWAYSGTLHERATVAALAERYATELRGLLAHCARPGAGRCTPPTSPWCGSPRTRWTGSPWATARGAGRVRWRTCTR
ncbi:hypothetical protein ACFQVA_17230 [Actinomadura keratinilytica]